MIEICRFVGITRWQGHVIQNNSINTDYNLDEIRRQFWNNQKSEKVSLN